MGCKITIIYTDNINSLLKMGIAEATAYNGEFRGDINSGDFNISALGGVFTGSYCVTGKRIDIDISKKPIFIPCAAIESFLRIHIK